MTIRRRYHLSLVIVLALFSANLFAYFWSARTRSIAEVEWSNATAGELKIFSIHQELDLLNKEVSVASQLQQEYKNTLVNDEIAAFERRTRAELTEIDDLEAASPAGLRPAIEDFRKNYVELSEAWLTFYRNAGPEDPDNAAAVRGLVRADELAQVVFGLQLPNLQAMEAAQVSHAQVQFQSAERLARGVIIATFVLSVLIAFALSVVLSRRLEFGFSTVKRGAQLIGEMDLEYRIAYPHTDEFLELARAFNEMAGKLALAQQQFVETNRQLGESESRYRNLVDRAVYGIFRCSNGRILEANPALVKMLGYNNAGELLALDMVTGVYCDPRDYGELDEKMAQTGSIEGFEVKWKKKNGEIITTRLSGKLVRSAANAIEREMIAENVTEHRALEEQLRQAQKMEAVGKLAGGIAHDFNNLLTVIKGHCELLHAEMKPGDARRKEVEGVIRAADRAVSLTRQLLAFSRRQLLTLMVLDLNSTVSSMERLLSRLLGENIQLTTALQPSLAPVKADPHQIEQVIMNLAVNARDAMPTGGKLRIATSHLQLENELRQGETVVNPGSYVLLSVTDTGHGMDETTLSRAFEPFFTTKEQGQGTGLGLSTVYGIVKQSGGEIWAESVPGKGTTFHVCFPAAVETTRPDADLKLVVQHSGEETILIVEDEDDVRDVASLMLNRRGYHVLAAKNSAEAENFCRTTQVIHLLLTDVVLRETSGQALAQVLTAIRPEMKVIYMSGYTDDVVLKHGIQNSQVAFLPKPFTRDELTSKVREVLGKVAVPTSAS